MGQDTRHVFLVGAKSLGAYGGYETFINKLTEYHQDHPQVTYHVACKANGDGAMDESTLSGVTPLLHGKDGPVTEFMYNGAHCRKIRVPNIGPAQAVYYDLAALWKFCRYIRANRIDHPVVYIMACRIGFFAPFFYHWIHRLGGELYVNPDGHEWMRAKWNRFIRKYWKISEQIMVRYSDLVVCDSVNIERYIHGCYDGKALHGKDPLTTYIAYGAEVPEQEVRCSALSDWYARYGLEPKSYYLIVGRFVPENNYETMIREFMASSTSRSLVLLTNTNEKFLRELEQKLAFSTDPRIRFVDPVYDQELLAAIRQNAFAYLHGHEVGGTNPSLLEAMGTTKLNLLLDVPFNREVADTSGLYWRKEPGDLSSLIHDCDRMEPADIDEYGRQAKGRIKERYSWQFIADQYLELFCGKNHP